MKGYALSALAAIMLLGGGVGFMLCLAHLMDRAADWNERRKQRAWKYRALRSIEQRHLNY